MGPGVVAVVHHNPKKQNTQLHRRRAKVVSTKKEKKHKAFKPPTKCTSLNQESVDEDIIECAYKYKTQNANELILNRCESYFDWYEADSAVFEIEGIFPHCV